MAAVLTATPRVLPPYNEWPTKSEACTQNIVCGIHLYWMYHSQFLRLSRYLCQAECLYSPERYLPCLHSVVMNSHCKHSHTIILANLTSIAWSKLAIRISGLSKCMFNFIRGWQTTFQIGSSTLHAYQWWPKLQCLTPVLHLLSDLWNNKRLLHAYLSSLYLWVNPTWWWLSILCS